MEDNLPTMIRTVHDQKKINAVVIDVDFNLSYAKLLRAEFYVKLQPDCLFIKGLTDKKISVTPELSFMGKNIFIILYNLVQDFVKCLNSFRSMPCLTRAAKNLS